MHKERQMMKAILFQFNCGRARPRIISEIVQSVAGGVDCSLSLSGVKLSAATSKLIMEIIRNRKFGVCFVMNCAPARRQWCAVIIGRAMSMTGLSGRLNI